MVHLEFGQDRMAQPVAGLRVGLAFGGKTARGLLCTSTGTFTMFTAVTTVGSARGPETLGSFLNPAVAAAKLAQSRYLTSPKNGPLAKISKRSFRCHTRNYL